MLDNYTGCVLGNRDDAPSKMLLARDAWMSRFASENKVTMISVEGRISALVAAAEMNPQRYYYYCFIALALVLLGV